MANYKKMVSELSIELNGLYDACEQIADSFTVSAVSTTIVMEELQHQITKLETELFAACVQAGDPRPVVNVFERTKKFKDTLKIERERTMEDHVRYGRGWREVPKLPKDYMAEIEVGLMRYGAVTIKDKYLLNDCTPKYLLALLGGKTGYCTGFDLNLNENMELVDWLYTECYSGKEDVHFDVTHNGEVIMKLVVRELDKSNK